MSRLAALGHLGSRRSLEHFMRAALVDLEDVRRNAAEGIHAASAGGVWQAVVFGFGGLRLTEDEPIAHPVLPPGWTSLKFRVQWHNQWYEFDLKRETQALRTMPVTPLSNQNSAPRPEIRGVIFDLDGVLADTSEYHYLSWKRLADEEGIPFDREANEAIRGLARRDSLLYLLGDSAKQIPGGNPRVTESQFQAMMDRKNRYYLDLIEHLNPADLLPGVGGLLEELKAAGIKIALGSSSKNAQDVIQRLGVVDYIDAIADGYSVVNPKPAPEVFLQAAAKIGLTPAECLVVEDADAGVEAASAAGMRSVKLGARMSKATVTLPSLDGVLWNDLLEKIRETEVSGAIAG